MFGNLFLLLLFIVLVALVYSCKCDMRLKYALYCMCVALVVLSLQSTNNIENLKSISLKKDEVDNLIVRGKLTVIGDAKFSKNLNVNQTVKCNMLDADIIKGKQHEKSHHADSMVVAPSKLPTPSVMSSTGVANPVASNMTATATGLYCNGDTYDNAVKLQGIASASANCYNIKPDDYCNGDTYASCFKSNGAWCNTGCKDKDGNVYRKTAQQPVASNQPVAVATKVTSVSNQPVAVASNSVSTLPSDDVMIANIIAKEAQGVPKAYCNGDTLVNAIKSKGTAWAMANCYNIKPDDYCNGDTYANCSKANGPWCNTGCKDKQGNSYPKVR
jgi:hypothetical protein